MRDGERGGFNLMIIFSCLLISNSNELFWKTTSSIIKMVFKMNTNLTNRNYCSNRSRLKPRED